MWPTSRAKCLSDPQQQQQQQQHTLGSLTSRTISSLKTLLEGIKIHLPDMYELFAENKNFFATPKEQEKIKDIYSRCKNISIDYGVMERASNVYVISSDFGSSLLSILC
jgi:general stress protein 26